MMIKELFGFFKIFFIIMKENEKERDICFGYLKIFIW